jgi:hypothetical protein
MTIRARQLFVVRVTEHQILPCLSQFWMSCPFPLFKQFLRFQDTHSHCSPSLPALTANQATSHPCTRYLSSCELAVTHRPSPESPTRRQGTTFFPPPQRNPGHLCQLSQTPEHHITKAPRRTESHSINRPASHSLIHIRAQWLPRRRQTCLSCRGCNGWRPPCNVRVHFPSTNTGGQHGPGHRMR